MTNFLLYINSSMANYLPDLNMQGDKTTAKL